jgi:hypothetical protein
MSEAFPEDVVSDVMKPVFDLQLPQVLQVTLARQSRDLTGLASSLLHAGMNEEQVRAVIGEACAVYRDELLPALRAFRGDYAN